MGSLQAVRGLSCAAREAELMPVAVAAVGVRRSTSRTRYMRLDDLGCGVQGVSFKKEKAPGSALFNSPHCIPFHGVARYDRREVTLAQQW